MSGLLSFLEKEVKLISPKVFAVLCECPELGWLLEDNGLAIVFTEFICDKIPEKIANPLSCWFLTAQCFDNYRHCYWLVWATEAHLQRLFFFFSGILCSFFTFLYLFHCARRDLYLVPHMAMREINLNFLSILLGVFHSSRSLLFLSGLVSFFKGLFNYARPIT